MCGLVAKRGATSICASLLFFRSYYHYDEGGFLLYNKNKRRDIMEVYQYIEILGALKGISDSIDKNTKELQRANDLKEKELKDEVRK